MERGKEGEKEGEKEERESGGGRHGKAGRFSGSPWKPFILMECSNQHIFQVPWRSTIAQFEERVGGARLVASRIPQESRGRNSSFEAAGKLILSQCWVSGLLQILWERRVIYKFVICRRMGETGCGLTSL